MIPSVALALLLSVPATPPPSPPPLADDVLTPEHVARLKSVTSAAVSPDGRHVAYVLAVPRVPGEDDNGSAWRELHVASTEGGSRPYVTGDVSVSGVEWTPDGRHVSYLAKRGDDEHACLYVIPVDGGESRRVLEHETGIRSYTWSPDGDRVAFLAADEDEEAVEKLEKQGFDAEVYEEQLHYVRVWIATPDDEEAEPRQLELEGNASELHWSPVGDELAVALAPTPLIDDHYMLRRVHVVDAESGEVLERFENPGKLGAIAWSPDGTRLAFVSAEDLNDPKEGRLMVAERGRGQFVDLLPAFRGHVSSIAWRDAETLAFLADVGSTTALEEIRADGTERRTLVSAGARPLYGLTVARDGSVAAMTSDDPHHAPEAWALAFDGGGPRRLTDSNPWLADLRMAEQRVERYRARDGMELEGILIEPLDREEGVRYPLILVVHGGPEAHIRNGWLTRYSYPGQVAAARGFAVFYPNYRGSTGRGVEFSKAGQADYGGKEFDDLVDAVDHLVETGLVDRERVGVTGGSYGGFATAWCSTRHSERFAAGVMFVGISNHVSKSGTTDIPNEMYQVHARKRLWDDWQFFLERSPLYYVEQARTPLLILHGKEDPRVHPSQSLELYRQIKVLGETPVRLVYYPGEGHGNRRAAARYDYSLRSLRWFEHYLQGEGGDAPPHELDYPLLEDDEPEDEPEGVGS